MTKHARQLLHWYDMNGRQLPWRKLQPDPYEVWLSEIMLQQTIVTTALPYFASFTRKWPDIFALAAADEQEILTAWAGLGYYARARNLLATARIIAHDHNGRFPRSERALLALPGIGPYTAAAICAIAFDQPAIVIDGNIERIVCRLAAIDTPLPAARPRIRQEATRRTPNQRPGDYAQAMMDLGATICIPKTPRCDQCPLRTLCTGYKTGIAASLPRRPPRRAKPVRTGLADILLTSDQRILMLQRPKKCLLGGMLVLPGSNWFEGASTHLPHLLAPNPTTSTAYGLQTLFTDLTILPEAKPLADPVSHIFTHFQLALTVRLSHSPLDHHELNRLINTTAANSQAPVWIARQAIDNAPIPAVIQKALTAALARSHPSPKD